MKSRLPRVTYWSCDADDDDNYSSNLRVEATYRGNFGCGVSRGQTLPKAMSATDASNKASDRYRQTAVCRSTRARSRLEHFTAHCSDHHAGQMTGDQQLSCSLAMIVAAVAAIICPFLTMAAATAVGAGYGESRGNSKDEDTSTKGDKNNESPSVPFFYVPPMKTNCQDTLSAEPPFGDLLKSLDKYRLDTSSFLASLTRQHEVARRSEWIIYGKQGDTLENSLLAAAYREKIGRIAECLESDYEVLEDLMKPFEVTVGLPSPQGEIVVDGISNDDNDKDRSHSQMCIDNEDAEELRYTAMPGRRRGTDDDGRSYDSAAQIVTHVVRDWSAQGQTIRQSLYSWCVDMVDKYHFKEKKRIDLPILVPGSGLGRLAYELSTAGHAVEANDVSMSMVTVAEKLLNGHVAVKSKNLHPFSFDFLVNEVDSDSRYDSITFPDIDISPGKRLSYTLGDFVTTYGSTQRREKYGAVVSCFFIDTATNIYEYLAVISSALCSGGLWVNVGPVQWHQNALVQPSGLELKMLIQGFGFEIRFRKGRQLESFPCQESI